jgi:hypothetical protein
MSARGTNLVFVIAAGTTLALTAIAAAPSQAAGDVTAAVSYGCDSGGGAPAARVATPAAAYSVAAPPARMTAGQTVKLGTTATFSLDGTDSALVAAVLGAPPRTATAVGGRIRTHASNKAVGLHLKIARAAFGNALSGATTANVSGRTLLRWTHVGTFTPKLGHLGLLHLQGYDSTGARTKSLDFPSADGNFARCANLSGRTALKRAGTAATVRVRKDRTTTRVGAVFSRAKHRISATTKVRSHFGIKARGRVKVRLKRGARTLRTVRVRLNGKGVAKTAFRVTRAGRYTVTSGYGGSNSLKGSSGSTRLRAG